MTKVGLAKVGFDPEETSHNSIGHGTQVSTRIRTHNSFHSRTNVCRDLLQTFAHASHHNSWTFVADHPTISNLTFRSHSPSVDVFAYDVSTLDQCCVLIVRRRNSHNKLKRVVDGWNTQLNSTRPLSHASTLHIFNWNLFVPPRCHQLFFSFTTPPETHQRQKSLKFLRTWCVRQHVCPVLCSRYLLQSRTSRSNQVLKPQDSRIYVLHASNTSSVKECMCCAAVHFDFNFVVSQTNKHQPLLQQQCLLDSF